MSMPVCQMVKASQELVRACEGLGVKWQWAGTLWCVSVNSQGTVAGVNGLGSGAGRRGKFGTRWLGDALS